MSQEHAFYRSKTFNRRKIWLMFLAVFFVLMFLGGRLVYLMVFCSEYYGQKAEDLHERERDIKAARGRIIDATGKILATNKSVCTISVIHSQIDEPEKVIAALQKELGLTEEEVRKRVEKVSSIERVKTNVDKETGDRIRAFPESRATRITSGITLWIPWRPRCSALRVRITREFWGLKSNTIPICRERAARSSPSRMRAGLRLKMRERRGLSR